MRPLSRYGRKTCKLKHVEALRKCFTSFLPPSFVRYERRSVGSRRHEDDSVLAFDDEADHRGPRIQPQKNAVSSYVDDRARAEWSVTDIVSIEEDDDSPQAELAIPLTHRGESSSPGRAGIDQRPGQTTSSPGQRKEGLWDRPAQPGESNEALVVTGAKSVPVPRVIKTVSVRLLEAHQSGDKKPPSDAAPPHSSSTGPMTTENDVMDFDFDDDCDPMAPVGRGALRGSMAFSTTSMSVDSLAMPRQTVQNREMPLGILEHTDGSLDPADLQVPPDELQQDGHVVEIGTGRMSQLSLESRADSAANEDGSLANLSRSGISEYDLEDFEEASPMRPVQTGAADPTGDTDSFEYTLQRGAKPMYDGFDDDDDDVDDVLMGTTKVSYLGSTGGTGGGATWKTSNDDSSDLHAKTAGAPFDVPVAFDEGVASASLHSATWLEGRAPVDLIEIAQALDVFVSAVRLERPGSIQGTATLEYKFLGVNSRPSSEFPLTKMSVCPVNFASHMKFNKEACGELRAEIEDEGEALGLQILLMREQSDSKEIFGIANVNLWVMVEDSCPIVRQVYFVHKTHCLND